MSPIMKSTVYPIILGLTRSDRTKRQTNIIDVTKYLTDPFKKNLIIENLELKLLLFIPNII